MIKKKKSNFKAYRLKKITLSNKKFLIKGYGAYSLKDHR